MLLPQKDNMPLNVLYTRCFSRDQCKYALSNYYICRECAVGHKVRQVRSNLCWHSVFMFSSFFWRPTFLSQHKLLIKFARRLHRLSDADWPQGLAVASKRAIIRDFGSVAQDGKLAIRLPAPTSNDRTLLLTAEERSPFQLRSYTKCTSKLPQGKIKTVLNCYLIVSTES